MKISVDRLTLRPPREGDVSKLPGYAADLVIADGDAVFGGLGLTQIRRRTTSLSYWIVPPARRQGVATHAVRLLAARTGERIELIADVTNIAAQRVALNAGFGFEGLLRGVELDEVIWARLPGDPPDPTPRVFPDPPGGEPTDGVISLRPIGMADVDDLEVLLNLPEVYERAVPPEPKPRAQVARRCANSPANWLAGTRADFTIRVDGGFAGDIGLYNDGPPGEGLIGYSVSPALRGRGVATRALRLVSRWAFDSGFARLCAGTAPDNVASQRVLEKAGFTRECLQPARLPGPDGTRIDNVQFAALPGQITD